MKKSELIFKNISYKLYINVADCVNDYGQYIIFCNLALYTLDGQYLGKEVYKFPKYYSDFDFNIDKGFAYFKNNLILDCVDIRKTAFDIYCTSLRNDI